MGVSSLSFLGPDREGGWYETGTPTFLLKLLSQRQVFLPELSHLQTDAALLGTFDVGNIPTEALMFSWQVETI